MSPVVLLAVSLPWCGPPPDGRVHALVFAAPGYTYDHQPLLAQKAYESIFQTPWTLGAAVKRINDPLITEIWLRQHLRVESVGPWVFRLSVSVNLPRQRQAAILNGVVGAFLAEGLTRERRVRDESLKGYRDKVADYRNELLQTEAAFQKATQEDKRKALLTEIDSYRTQITRFEVRVNGLESWEGRGYPRAELLRPAAP